MGETASVTQIPQILGWVATAVFVGSYFFVRPAALRAVQMAGAVLWIVYGFLIEATPVIAANALVFTAAAWTFFARTPSSVTAAACARGES
jgi:uncharacterized protein with PQ loop repeat